MILYVWLLLVIATLTSAKPIFVGYYSLWRQEQNKKVDLTKYTHINLSFAIAEDDGSVVFKDTVEMPNLVMEIKEKGPKVLVSVGGWTGSKAISTILADETKSAKFTSQIIDLVKSNELDGIDIDWEYPGKKGLECNAVDLKKDTPRFLKFLRQLRSKFDSEFGSHKKLISLAVAAEPFHIDGKPTNDVAEFAKVVDYASIMAFDVNGGWSKTTGPNAPLNFEQGKGDAFSLASAIESWTSAKWPANQLVAGLPFYGRALTASEDMTKDPDNMYQPKEKVIPKGDWEDAKEKADAACGVEEAFTGQYLYQHLRQSALTGPDKAHKDWIRTWDKVSETPWLFNPRNKTFITYDDPRSITAKVKLASEKGLAGAMVWATDKDYRSELVKAMLSWPEGGSGNNQDDNSEPGTEDDGPSPDDDSTSPDTGDAEPTDKIGDPTDATGDTADATGDTTDATGDATDPTGDTTDPTGDTADATGDTADATGDTADATGDTTDPTGDTTDATGDATDTTEDPADTSEDPADNNKGTCSTEGQLSCTAPGTSPDYTVCIFGSPIKLQCGPGTVCVKLEGAIYCGWGKPGNNS
ncbi:hypothetical protein H4R20_004182 [Coemansia guatemalensis]|uniref:GH18 domain-containing protein n=1 Tax=Coemansia guatemalensis TaxID=2761395 RepID=A0A9W8HRY8_9FUNG|nr:hypothetical protein H4R20_004182 [Coemansia guatemalensis]